MQSEMKTIIPVRPRNANDLLQLVEKIGDRAHWVEVWLDKFEGDVPRIKSHKLIGCCKTPEERGNFVGTAEDKIEILQKFLKSGGDLVDLDITRNGEAMIHQIPSDKLLLSYHNFEKMPNKLDDIVVKMYFLSPAICKFSVTINDPISLELFLDFVRNFPSNQSAIFTTMGSLGREGRDRILEMKKSWGRFVALNKNSTTDPSQKNLDEI
jgi:3-dehydroquinate dehydratase I